MKVSPLLFLILLTQVSGSFFDDSGGGVTSWAENLENFVSDVIYDVRETIDCSILAVKQVLALGNFADLSYYNKNCRPTDDVSESQEDTDSLTAPSFDTSEIANQEDDTVNIPESVDVLVKTKPAQKKRKYEPEETNVEENDRKNKDFKLVDTDTISNHYKIEKNKQYKVANHSEKGNSNDNYIIKQDSVNTNLSAESHLKDKKLENAKVNSTKCSIIQPYNKNDKNKTGELKPLDVPQNMSHKTLYKDKSFNVSEFGGNKLDKNSPLKKVENKLHSLIDTHKKLKETKNRLENKTKDLNKLHSIIHHKFANLTAIVMKEANTEQKNRKNNETKPNISKKGNELISQLSTVQHLNKNTSKTNNISLSYQGDPIKLSNGSKTLHGNASMSKTKETIKENSTFATSNQFDTTVSAKGVLSHISNTQNIEQKERNTGNETIGLVKTKTLLHNNLTANHINKTVNFGAPDALSRLNKAQNKLEQSKNKIDSGTIGLGKTKIFVHNNTTSNNIAVNKNIKVTPSLSNEFTEAKILDTVIHNTTEHGNDYRDNNTQLNILNNQEINNVALSDLHMTKNKITAANNSSIENSWNKAKNNVSVHEHLKYTNSSIDNPITANVSEYRGTLEKNDNNIVTNKLITPLGALNNQAVSIGTVPADIVSATRNKSEGLIKNIKTNSTVTSSEMRIL
ncbi:hypothetical protein ACJJTC_008289 [Scirpophaga incertulas]